VQALEVGTAGIQLEDRADTAADPKFSKMCNERAPERSAHPIHCVSHMQAAS